MLRLEKVTGKNVWDILKLDVEDWQKNFVASNDISIIEAYTAITGNGFAFPFGIYDEDIPVGFLMVGFDSDDYWDNAPDITANNYNLWRLMIDKNYQHRGYGKKQFIWHWILFTHFPAAKRSIAGYLMTQIIQPPRIYMLLSDLRKPETWTRKK